MLAYKLSGNKLGQNLVFVHGLCEHKEIWQEVVKPLESRYQIVCVDLPNFGESPAMLGNLSMDDLSHALHQTLQNLGIGQSLLVGHSLGGYVDLAYTASYTTAVAGLCLFHSTALPDSEERKLFRDKAIENIQQNGTEAYLRALFPNLFAQPQQHLRTIENLTAQARNISQEGLIAVIKAIRNRTDQTELLKSVNLPVGFIIGKKDNALPFESSLMQVAMPKESYALVLDNVGHQGMMEAQNQCSKFVEQFANYVWN